MKYVKPEIDLLLFDEVETVNTSVTQNNFAAGLANEYMYGDSVKASGTTTITIQKALKK